MIDAEEIKKAREILKTATEGPWMMGFIAFARATLPAALDEIERLQTENAKLKKALAECAGY